MWPRSRPEDRSDKEHCDIPPLLFFNANFLRTKHFSHFALLRFRGTSSVTKRMVWAEDEDFTGWCCSQCRWAVTAPRLDTTVAALAFNRSAEEGFNKHSCVASVQAGV